MQTSTINHFVLPALRNDEQHAIFARDLKSVLRLTVGVSNIYCELQQICHLNIEGKLQ